MDSTSSTQNTLKPCPFCGSKAELLGGPEWWVTCTFKGVCIAERRGGCTFKEDAIRIWNKRAAPSVSDGGSSDASRVSLQKQIESLLAACKAKDEALTKIAEGLPHFGTVLLDTKGREIWLHDLIREALALQPDSSVKPDFQTSEGDKSITIRALP